MESPWAGRGNVKRTDSETEAAEDATRAKERKRTLEDVTSEGGVPRHAHAEGGGLALVSVIGCRQIG